ncbi:MAG TPA: class F sortase [Micromonosporaceae bacterium]|nr:class F sortase [Micromonosporaceae bacterium]
MKRPYWVIGAALVFVGLFGAGAGLGQLTGTPSLPGFGSAHDEPSGPSAGAMARSAPTTISIPSIGVQAPVMQVGLASNGAVATPPLDQANLAGWFSGGPAPGEMGPAVVVGHVDGPHGASVFYKLGSVHPGAQVRMELANHRTAMFTVYSVEYYPKGKFPGNKVYGDYSRPGLRLITCGGPYLGGSVGYADNVVVYASLTKRG